MNERIRQIIAESVRVKQNMLEDAQLCQTVSALADEIARSLGSGGRLVLCGNGGSACDALHFASEIVGKFQAERSPWSAIALNADVGSMTAIANDYGYDEIFARQAEGHVRPGDVFLGISTSGNSTNILRAVRVAKRKGAKTAALLGRDGGKVKSEVDFPVVVHSDVTARIQECHICLIHIICEIVEECLKDR